MKVIGWPAPLVCSARMPSAPVDHDARANAFWRLFGITVFRSRDGSSFQGGHRPKPRFSVRMGFLEGPGSSERFSHAETGERNAPRDKHLCAFDYLDTTGRHHCQSSTAQESLDQHSRRRRITTPAVAVEAARIRAPQADIAGIGPMTL